MPTLPTVTALNDLLAHATAVRRCRATACFAALAAHFGTNSPVVLEARVDRRRAYVTGNGDRSWSGVYRRWLRDGTLPRDKTIDHVLERSAGAVDLRRWRDLMLWGLLTPAPQLLNPPEVRAAQFSQQIRRIVFENFENHLRGKFRSLQIPPKRILSLRNLRSLEAFHALVYLARESELIGDSSQDLLPAICAFEILPTVLQRHRPLRFHYEGFFSCFERVMCRRLLYSESSYSILEDASAAVRTSLTANFSSDIRGCDGQ